MTNEELNERINKEWEGKELQKGKVKWFNADKGFGFIERDGQKDIFVHFEDIQMDGYRTLEEGEEVEFDVEPTAKGEQAINVRKVEE